MALLLVIVALSILYFFSLENYSTRKGRKGEQRVARALRYYLENTNTYIFNDITLRNTFDSTQIDHIVICSKGIIVIETKNYSGWIFGNSRNKNWTQVIYRTKTQFQNPLRQNYKHLKFVQEKLKAKRTQLHSLVIFNDGCEFKTELPQNVIQLSGLRLYLEQMQEHILNDLEIEFYATSLKSIITN